MKITVKIKTHFGRRDIYPACDKARAFARIAGATTLTADVIDQVKVLGFVVEVEPSEPATL